MPDQFVPQPPKKTRYILIVICVGTIIAIALMVIGFIYVDRHKAEPLETTNPSTPQEEQYSY